MRNTLVIFAILILYSCGYKKLEVSHVDFLKKQNLSAKDYVINQFEKHDLVIICERDHKDFTQYELILEIVKDPFFIENVGHIFTEVGVANMDSEINKFLLSEQIDSVSTRNRITSIFREIDSSPFWHCYNYPWFLGEIFNINQTLNGDKKITLHPSDSEFDWSKCNTAEDYKAFDNSIVNRDSMMAQNIIQRFDIIQTGKNMRKKALVIMNYKHAFLKDHRFLGKVTHNTGRYLSDYYKNNVASIYLMGLAIPKVGSYTVVKNGKWDYYFEKSKKTDVGFNLKNSPFGIEEFDVIPPDSIQQFKYEDMFTGLVYYRLLQEHEIITGWEDFATDDFIPELYRRMKIFNEAMELGMSEQDLKERLFVNNTVKKSQYSNLKNLREQIDNWKNGL